MRLARRTTPITPTKECAVHGVKYKPVAFVHINKAGGTWMRDVLVKYARHQMVEAAMPQAGPKLRVLGSRFFHASASLQRRALGQADWDRSYRFALVRNPFARQLSMFTFLLQEAGCRFPKSRRPEHCEQRFLPEAGPWLSNHTEVGIQFRQWIRRLALAHPHNTVDAHLFGARSHGNEIDPWYNASQLSWLVERSGTLLVEVIRLEELRSAWPKLQASICGLERITYEQTTQSSSQARRNPSRHLHYSFYYDDATRRTVESYMAADLATFGYTFENDSK